MAKPGPVAAAPEASRLTRSAAAALLAAGLAANLLGVSAGAEQLWIAGYWIVNAGIVVGVVTLAVLRTTRIRMVIGVPLHVLGLLLFALASWVRGAPSIPPDPGILVIQAAALVLVAVGTLVLVLRGP